MFLFKRKNEKFWGKICYGIVNKMSEIYIGFHLKIIIYNTGFCLNPKSLSILVSAVKSLAILDNIISLLFFSSQHYHQKSFLIQKSLELESHLYKQWNLMRSIATCHPWPLQVLLMTEKRLKFYRYSWFLLLKEKSIGRFPEKNYCTQCWGCVFDFWIFSRF